ncbi:MAG: hypothetical protein ACREJ4_03610 [Candidatus Methylomirabilaceae bacterium]
MIKILAVVALLAIAQIIPSCGDDGGGGSRPQVIGWVDEKVTRNQTAETNPYLLVINNVEYGVPYDFWRTVDQGDLVKFDGEKWTIVRKGRP